MNWTDDFIKRCLMDIPPGRYRRRVEAELRDHMETQHSALIESGIPPRWAKEAVRNLMGDPEQLRKEYTADWSRTFQAWTCRALERGTVIGIGCVLMGMLYILTFIFLAVVGFTYDGEMAGRCCFPILSKNPLYLRIFSLTLFLGTFPLGGLFLRRCFRNEDRPALWVTLGLLAAWAGEKASIILLSALIYGMPPGPELLIRIYHGGDTTAPWLNPAYYLLSFAGCLALGWLVGRKTERSTELA